MRFLYQMMKRSLLAPNTWRKLTQSEVGFSLLELLIVLFCLSALLSLAIPGYQQVVEDLQLRSTANQLYADVKECQSLANMYGESFSVQLARDNGYEVWTEGGKRKEITFPKGIRISDRKLAFNRPMLEFNDKGHPVGGGTIVLGNEHGKEIRLTVHLHTGQIQLKEGSE